MDIKSQPTSAHSVIAFQTIDKAHARLAVRVTKAATRPELAKLDQAVQKRGLALIAGSGRVLHASGERDLNHVVSVFATRQAVTKPATAANKARFVAVAASANMFLDPETNQTWTLAEGVLRRNDNIETEEHLKRLLASVCPHAQTHEGVVTASSMVPPVVDSGMYAIYASGHSLGEGYIVAVADDQSSVLIADRDAGTAVHVPMGLVIEATELTNKDGSALKGVSDKVTVANAAEALAYYKKIYGYNKEFFARFAAQFKSRGAY